LEWELDNLSEKGIDQDEESIVAIEEIIRERIVISKTSLDKTKIFTFYSIRCRKGKKL